MGLSAISILLCHANGNQVAIHSFFARVLSIGGYGVDVFLFLSGLGLWYSLSNFYRESYKKNASLNLLGWYKKRYKRLIITYLFVSVPFYSIYCVINGLSFTEFLSYVSTVSFWTSHQGQWFVDALIPLYAISPFLFFCFKKEKTRLFVLIVLSLVCLGITAMPNNEANPLLSVWGNVQYVVGRVPSFVFGMWLAPYILANYRVRRPLVYVIISSFLYFLTNAIPYHITSACFTTIPLVFVFVWIVNLSINWANRLFAFFGRISLESYLFNVTLPYFVFMISWENTKLGQGRYFPYFLIILLGTFLSVIVNRIVKVILIKCQ